MTDALRNSKLNALGKIYINLKRSSVAYNNYIKEGKTYLHARVLKDCNVKTRELLLENAHILNEDLRNDSIDLINHYDIWIEKWINLKQKRDLELDDVFIFENKYRFPRDAERRLKEEFFKIIKNR